MTTVLRERLASIVAVGAIVAIIGWFVLSSYFDELQKIQTATKTRQAEVDELEKTARRLRREAARLTGYREKSLPPQVDEARARYQEWLLDQVGGAQLDDVQINQISAREQGGAYRQLGFNVSGKGTLQQVVALLHRFYSIDLLQRLKRVSLKPIRDSRLLDVVLTVEALSLPDAEGVKPGDRPRLQPSLGQVAAYEEVILNRNLLGPANLSPQLDSISSQRGTRNQSVSFSAKAKDADALDQLTFSLGPQAPSGARIDPQTGAFRWTAGAPGNYQVTIRVADNGYPPKTDSALVTIQVGETPPPPPPTRRVETPPPPPKPNLELGKLAFITAITELDGRPQVWITVRSTGEVLQLLEGEKWLINGLSGMVKKIGEEDVEMELIDKKRYAVRLGDNLSQAVEASAARTAAPIESP